MNEMSVVGIDWIGEDSADLTLANGVSTVVAFCHPCSYQLGQTIHDALHPVEVDELQSPYFQDWPPDEKAMAGAPRLERYCRSGYCGCGKVIDESAGLVEVLGFVFDFGETPAGAEVVQFRFARLNVR